jgi:hypothetical protein
MRISGFTFTRNAVKLYYPMVESISSILPIVDEFIVIACPGDKDDDTLNVVSSIKDAKLRIIESRWPSKEEAGTHVYSYLTNLALEQCTGDWCFYLQADEVVHEEDLPKIESTCRRYLGDNRIEGMLFDYLHFWGDYKHYQSGHGWYKREIRMVRNRLGIRSKGDAQSFRHADGHKLTVALSGGRIFHYGYTRPPDVMRVKAVSSYRIYVGDDAKVDESLEFDYGPLKRLAIFTGTHPALMEDRIKRMDWQIKLRDTDPPGMVRVPHKDERFKYRFLTAIEKWTGLDLGHKSYRRIIRG